MEVDIAGKDLEEEVQQNQEQGMYFIFIFSMKLADRKNIKIIEMGKKMIRV